MSGVLLDLTQIPLERTGVGIYAVNYVRCLREVPDVPRMHFLVLDDDHELLALAKAVPGATLTVLRVAIFRRFVFRVLIEQVLIPWLALTRSLDAVHSLHYSFPLLSFGRFRRIVTVCDMSFFLFPELHVPAKRVFFQFFIRRLPKADGLLFISGSTQRDFETRFPQSGASKAVVHLGADLERLAAPADEAVLADLRQRFGIGEYVLYVGTIEPRKNLLGLMQAFEQCAGSHPGVKLVIAGKLGWDYQKVIDYARASKFADRIVLTGYIDEAQKHALLKAATVFAYVSFYEGFGLPVLEGMASGVPTVTSNISSMPEVAGDGALLADPGDVGQISAALSALLDDQAARDSLVQCGLARSRRFTWAGMTANSLAFYRQVISGR